MVHLLSPGDSCCGCPAPPTIEFSGTVPSKIDGLIDNEFDRHNPAVNAPRPGDEVMVFNQYIASPELNQMRPQVSIDTQLFIDNFRILTAQTTASFNANTGDVTLFKRVIFISGSDRAEVRETSVVAGSTYNTDLHMQITLETLQVSNVTPSSADLELSLTVAIEGQAQPVTYTHLTLPTKRIV